MMMMMMMMMVMLVIIISEYFNRITLQCKSTVINKSCNIKA